MENTDSPALHAAVLAAGPATRFGSPKQLVRIGGTPLVHQMAARAATVAGHSVTVVLGAHAREVAPALGHSSASTVVNRDWEEGLASSIRTAVRSAPPQCEGLLLLLCEPGCRDCRRPAPAVLHLAPAPCPGGLMSS